MSKFTSKVTSVVLTVTTAATLSGFGSFVAVAGAQSIQDQIAALLAQIAALQAQLNAGGTSCTFTRDLTLGSQGADVTCLQNFLTGTGHFTFAGGATGYFGPITQAAVAAWQAANGVSPAAGYFGPISRAKMAAGGSTGTGTGTGTTIGRSGKEGTATLTLAPTPSAGQDLPEGEKDKGIYGIEVEAVGSEIYLERVKLQFNTIIYRVINWIGIYRDGVLLAQKDVNSSTVNKESSTSYTLQIDGFSSRVDAGTKGRFEVRVNAEPVYESSYITNDFTILLPANGARLTDGAGINIFEPASALSSRSIDVTDSDADNATIVLSKAATTPNERYEQAGTDGKADKVTVGIFNLKAEKDSLLVTDATASVNASGGSGSAQTAYLYDGSTLIDSATISSGHVSWDDFEFNIPKDTTKPLTVKVDFTGVGDAVTSATATMAGSNLTVEASDGDALGSGSKSGSATSNRVHVAKRVAMFTLVSTSNTKTVGVSGVSSTSASGYLKFTLTAKGGDITVSSSNGLAVRTYKDGTESTIMTENYTITNHSSTDADEHTISDGTTATFEVNVSLLTTEWGTGNDGHYDFRLASVRWNGLSGVETAFLDDLTTDQFKTQTVYLR